MVVNLVVGGWRERRYIRNMDWIRNLNLHMLLTDMLDLSMAFLLIIHFFHHPMLSLTPAHQRNIGSHVSNPLVLQCVLALLPGDLLCDGVAALVQLEHKSHAGTWPHLGPALLLYLCSLFRYLQAGESVLAAAPGGLYTPSQTAPHTPLCSWSRTHLFHI